MVCAAASVPRHRDVAVRWGGNMTMLSVGNGLSSGVPASVVANCSANPSTTTTQRRRLSAPLPSWAHADAIAPRHLAANGSANASANASASPSPMAVNASASPSPMAVNASASPSPSPMAANASANGSANASALPSPAASLAPSPSASPAAPQTPGNLRE